MSFSIMSSPSKIRIYFSIDDEKESHVRMIDSTFTIQQTLQFMQDKNNDQNLQYVYINQSIIDDLDDLICDWNIDGTVFNFRHSSIKNETGSTSQAAPSDSYDFTVYTTANWDSLTKGQTFTLDKNMNSTDFENLIQDYCSIMTHIPTSQIKLFTFLPGGIEFTNTTLSEFVEIAKPEQLHIYVVISIGVSSNLITKEIVEICDVRGEMSTLFSPLTESTEQGKQLFACLLSSLFHQTSGRKEFVKSISKITAFPPLIASLQSLIDRKTIKGKDLIMITSPLFAIFKYLVDNSIAENKILESCTKICNLISQIDDSMEIPLENHSLNSTTDTTINSDKLTCIEQYMQNKNISALTFWKPDFESNQFQKSDVLPFTQSKLQNAWENKQHFKPVMPLTLLQVHVSSIVYGPNETYRVFVMDSTDAKEMEASTKVDLIDPETGKTTHEDIETFAKNVTEKEVDGEKIELIDEESVQQITMVLIDQSWSMEDHYNEDSEIPKDSLSKQFLTSWASKSFGYRISSLQGLISFADSATVKS